MGINLKQNKDTVEIKAIKRKLASLNKTSARLSESLNNLRTLIKINGIINSTNLNLEKLLNTIMKIAEKVMQSEASSLMLIDEKTGELVYEIARGKKGKHIKQRFKLKMGQGIAGWVAQNEKPLVVPDAPNDPRFYSAPDKETGFKTRSIICVPLKAHNKTIGVLQAINPIKKASFSNRDLPMFKAFANQAAVAIENAKVRQYQIEERRLKNELDIAQQIQQNFLPLSMPTVGGVHCWAKNAPAKVVGGDLYDFLILKNNKFAVLIGDVSGKGVPAALFMVGLITNFRFFAHMTPNPSDIFSRINNKMVKESALGMFATAALLMFDLKKHTVSYTNAGHFPPVLYNEGKGELREIEVNKALPLGIIKDVDYETNEIKLSKGDLFLLYTDGISEARNKHNAEYGRHRLMSVIKSSGASPKKIVEDIFCSVKEFASGKEQHDDITLVSAGYL